MDADMNDKRIVLIDEDRIEIDGKVWYLAEKVEDDVFMVQGSRLIRHPRRLFLAKLSHGRVRGSVPEMKHGNFLTYLKIIKDWAESSRDYEIYMSWEENSAAWEKKERMK